MTRKNLTSIVVLIGFNFISLEQVLGQSSNNPSSGKRFCTPVSDSPALSFSLMSFHPGDYNMKCKRSIAKAKATGFTSVTFIPAYAFSVGIGKNNLEASLKSGELTKCLDLAWEAGLDIVYQPHLDAPCTLNGTSECDWRAGFDMDPLKDNYKDKVLGEFNRWVFAHKEELKEGSRQVDLVLSAELEKSTTTYPGKWRQMVSNLKDLYLKEGTKNIRIGMNPNWYPKNDESLGSRVTCQQFRLLVQDLDFIAPSFYGDWSKAVGKDGSPRGRTQVEENKKRVQGFLSRTAPYKNCHVPEMSAKPFSVGEFGVGCNPSSAEGDCEVYAGERSAFRRTRKAIYQNLLDWAQHTPSGPPPLSINLWTTGVFDPFGIDMPNNREIVSEPDLADMLRGYSSKRCKDIVFPPDPTPVHGKPSRLTEHLK